MQIRKEPEQVENRNHRCRGVIFAYLPPKKPAESLAVFVKSFDLMLSYSFCIHIISSTRHRAIFMPKYFLYYILYAKRYNRT